ncbi:sodium-dependent transporter [Sporosarcina sp. P7]|uniref:sodium-dependent transporter n=1 Tax=Sporosarcina sp. P7 TaxID=2048244 RepID=UPI000C166287|nr:sodium-dependent transporter [Sporosarcina sp. P7]PID23401.1 hypothetical protein CSV60_15045 [Sporosarcina sp. P7]
MHTNNQWSSKLGFILAAAGSAIGLGAIWKFPYVAGTSGGGAFLLIFLLFTFLIGLPLLMGEFIIGRSTQKDAIDSYKTVAPGTSWHLIGRLGIVTCFILLSFYSVVGGWVLIYIWKAATGSLSGLTQTDYGDLFGNIVSSPYASVGAQLLFMVMTTFVIAKGVTSGIEKASKYMMPALFVLFIILTIRSFTLDGAMAGVSFFLKPNFGNITSETILFAMGQSFFALSIGVSVMVTYSSYLSKKESLPQSAISIVLMNLLVAILAGLVIFPAVFAFGLEPDAGPTLLFNVMPTIFGQLPFGTLFFLAFLILFLFAALTSAFSMLEIIVSATSKGDDKKRKKYAWMIGAAIFIVGIPSALSYGLLSDFTIFGMILFDAFDYLVSNILMPLGALLIAIFIPLKIPKDRLYDELKAGSNISKKIFSGWFLLIRYLAPVAILIVFADVLGLLDFLK